MPKTKTKKKPLTERELCQRIEAKHPQPAWAVLSQVRNCTGASSKIRTADALAMSLWPSRGIELHGFEIKSVRSDWLQELKKPEKAEEIAQFCHRWWIVANEGVVELSELPPTWGLMVTYGRGLKIAKQAKYMEAKDITFDFFASLMRKVTENYVSSDSVQGDINDAYKRGVERGKESHKWDKESHIRDFENLKESVEEFEKVSGVKIGAYNGYHMGRAVKSVLKVGDQRIVSQFRREIDSLKSIVNKADENLKEIEGAE